MNSAPVVKGIIPARGKRVHIMELLNDTILGIIIVIVVPAALILITAITSPIKDKDRNKHTSTNNNKTE